LAKKNKNPSDMEGKQYLSNVIFPLIKQILHLKLLISMKKVVYFEKYLSIKFQMTSAKVI